MTSIFEKDRQLQTIAKASKRRFGIHKGVLAVSIVLGVISQLVSALTILVLPALVLLVMGFATRALFGKSKEQRIAHTQIKLLKQATAASLMEGGINAQRVKDRMLEYPWSAREIEYGADVQHRFQALCQSAGVANGGILADERLL